MTLTGKQRGELVKMFYLNGQNSAAALRAFRHKHGLVRGPCTARAVRNLIRKFEETGCTCDRSRSGRPAVPVEAVAEVHAAVDGVRRASARGVSRALNMPNSTVRKILRSVLHMFPYRFQRVQMLEAGDNQLRLDFANEFLIRYDNDTSWPLHILWTDEAHFMLNGNVNSKNCVHWAEQNPHDVVALPLYDAKVTVWCGITSTFILGPYFFEETTVDGRVQSCTVTSDRYHNMLTHYVIPELQRRNALSNIVWMQDGAPPHVASSVKQCLTQHFGDRVISRHFPFPWPPRSPDLTPLDFWLWGYLKSKVYALNPQTASDLKDAIRREMQQIPLAMARAAVLSTICRMQSVIVSDGGHVENL